MYQILEKKKTNNIKSLSSQDFEQNTFSQILISIIPTVKK